MRLPRQECGNIAMKRVTVFVHVCVWLCTACVLPLEELQHECIRLNSVTSFGVVLHTQLVELQAENRCRMFFLCCGFGNLNPMNTPHVRMCLL